MTTNTIDHFNAGDIVRIGKGKSEWTVTRVTRPEEATMVRPAGLAVSRSTGHHRRIQLAELIEVTLVRNAPLHRA